MLALSVLLSVLVVLVPGPLDSQTPGQPSLIRPHILGIFEVSLAATNPRKSLDFYSKTFHLARDWNRTLPSETFFLNPDQDLWVFPAPVPAPANLLTQVTFTTDDASALRRYLEAHGIVASPPPASTGHEVYFIVKDPEGNRIGFMQERKGLAGPRPSGKKPVTDSDFASFPLIHAGFIVHDRAVEDKFYKDILGFHVYWHGGMKDGTDDWVDMQVPDGTDWIEYMLNVSQNADKRLFGVMNHIALGVPDIHTAEKQLRANGWTSKEKPQIGRDGKWQLNLYDPDDTRVELMEFTPTQKPCCSEFTGLHPGPKQ